MSTFKNWIGVTAAPRHRVAVQARVIIRVKIGYVS